MTPPAPLYAACVGLHGCASTWAFNVAREWLLAAGPAQDTLSFYADRVEDIPPEAATRARVLVKAHHGSPELEAWLAARPVRLILTQRDPRDAAISMAQRFKAPLRDTVVWLLNDCALLTRLYDRPHLLLRYETRFFEAPQTVAAVAAHLGLEAPPDRVRAIFEAWRTEAVRAFAQNMGALPAERRKATGAGVMDTLTQVHGAHIGDGRSGKWRQLPPEARQALTAAFLPYLATLGYRD